MTINELKEILEICLTDIENNEKAGKFGEAVKDYLDKNGANDEIIHIIVKGMDIDRGANFYDYLEGVSKKNLKSVWEIIRDSKVFEEFPENGTKFIYGILNMALSGEGEIKNYSGNIITKISKMTSDKNYPLSQEFYGLIFIDYVVSDFPKQNELPKWEEVKVTPEILKEFVQVFLVVVNSNSEEKNSHKFRSWLENGIRYADEKIEEKNIEAKIPKSKIDDLKKIVQHYEEVEQLVRDLTYREADLNKTLEKKTKEISELEKKKMKMEAEIKSLNNTVADLQGKAEENKREIEDRKKLNAAQVQYREDSQASLLQDIADSLKAEYADYALTKDDEMDVVMGEIYREKIKNIFNILEQKGIKVAD